MGETGVLVDDLLRVQAVAQIGGIQFHQQIPLLGIGALGQDAQDARRALQFGAHRHFAHRLDRSALDDGDQKIASFGRLIIDLCRAALGETPHHRIREEEQNYAGQRRPARISFHQ